MKLSIAVVSNRDHKAAFVGSLYALTQFLTHQGRECGVEQHAVSIGTGHSCLPMGRQQALSFTQKHGFSHLLFLDDDMAFSPHVVRSLISRKLPVVGANYLTKSDTPRYVASDSKHNPVSSRGKKGVEEVARLGMGIMLVDMAAIAAVKPPHFEVRWHQSGYISEDHYFCDKLREHGIKIHVDHDASQQVGHVGDFVYSLSSELIKE